MFVFALDQWCKIVSEVEGEGYCVELSDGYLSFVLADEVAAVCIPE